VNVQAAGGVTGTAGTGITATGGTGGAIVSSVAVTGSTSGIVASSGASTMVTSNGAIIGTSTTGISATGGASGTTSVFANSTVLGGTNGIVATSSGTSATNVQAASTVTGTSTTGISATGGSDGTTVNADSTVLGGTNGVVATSSGATSVTTNGTVTGTSTTGISATSTGASPVTVVANRTVTGGASGIIATSSVAGSSTTVTTNAAVLGTSTQGINISSGTGGLTLNANANVTSTGGRGIVSSSTAGGTLNINGTPSTVTVMGLGTSAVTAVVDITTASGSTTTLNNNGLIRSVSNSFGDLAIKGTTGSVVVNNNGRIDGRVDFSAVTGVNTVTFNNTSNLSWHTTGTSTFGPGADALNNSGLLATSSATTFAFGTGTDSFTNTSTGRVVIGEFAGVSSLTITALETFTNSGLVLFGSLNGLTSDGETNDTLTSAGTTYTGSGTTAIFAMDSFLGAAGSPSDVAVFQSNGSTAGLTRLLIKDTNAGFGAFNPTGILVVDVSGTGTSLASHFALHPSSDWFNPNKFGGVLDKPGLFFYDLVFDAANKEHLLVGNPDQEVMELPTLVTGAQSIWYDNTMYADRMADLRNVHAGRGGKSGNITPGVWLKAAGHWTERDDNNAYGVFNKVYNFDTSYEQKTYGVVGGADFGQEDFGGKGDALLGGVMGGYIASSLDFNASLDHANYDGFLVGGYVTYLKKGLFVDGVVKANILEMEYSAPRLGGFRNTGDATSIGGQVEGGYQFKFDDSSMYLEPLASASYVRTKIDGFTVMGTTIAFDSNSSGRGSVGARFGGVVAERRDYTLELSLTGRAWYEFLADNKVTVTNGASLIVHDDFTGAFGEVAGGMSFFGPGGSWSAFINGSVKANGNFINTGATTGMRFTW
jgi:outer membrane autotransporter protein